MSNVGPSRAEIERAKRIEENRRRLRELGIEEIVAEVAR